MLQAFPSLTDASAAVLAGGLGTRLRAVNPDRPKALVEIHGRPFLAYLLDFLSSSGLRSAVLCTGYRGEQIQRTFGSSYKNLRLAYSHEARPLGTGGALRLALPQLTSDPMLVMNGDSFCAADLEDFWSWHCRRGARASLLLTRVADAGRYGFVTLNGDGAITQFAEKRARGHGPAWINAGAYLLSRPVVESIPENTPTSLEYDIFPRLVGEGLHGYRSPERFLDIGTPQDFAAAEEFFTDAVTGE